MARGTTLANALLMLKGELGAITSTTGSDTELYTYIDLVQSWLASEWDWPFLETEVDIDIVAGTGSSSRYYNVPTLSFERPVSVSVMWNLQWHPVEFGIGDEEYNSLSSGDAGVDPVQMCPVRKWRWKPGDESEIEIWPLPQESQTLRFKGQRVLTSLKSGGSYSGAATLDLDDLLIVKFAAAQKLQRLGKKDGQIVLAQAEARLNRLRAADPGKFEEPLILGQHEYTLKKMRRPMALMVAGTSTGMVLQGTLLPEGNQAAPAGKLYFKTSEPQSLWLKTSGTGTTGWTELIGT